MRLVFSAIFHKVPKSPIFWPSDFVEYRKWEKTGVSMVPGSNSESLELFFCTVSSRLSRGSHLAPVGTILRFNRKNVFFRDFPQSPSTAFGVIGVKNAENHPTLWKNTPPWPSTAGVVSLRRYYFVLELPEASWAAGSRKK